MDASQLRHIVQIDVGGTWFGIESSCVREILGQRAWIPIPGSHRAAPGVLEWSGRAVATLDVRALEGTASGLEPGMLRRRNVIVQLDECTLALPVDAVREVVEIGGEAFRPRHITEHPYAPTEVDIAGRIVPVLDLGLVTAKLLEGGARAQGDR